ncbi:DAO-domain-containing protein [Gymnopus androsaceus JB14]|uniref:DAO-domain-containing protein n=1 Tax=Gymnopus androsaceus JB14 TaxID=1447944 RepID=A0A6A4HYJ5_9AGAR|nr:DAO-domain-containing protein [Gymnopus androsaceus JB14]
MLWGLLALSLPSTAFSSPFQVPLSFQPTPATLPVANSTESFWIHTPGANLLANEGSTGPLTQDADICIIGSGMTGVSAAYHLANAVDEFALKDVKAVVLEAREFCSGATGRNGGHLTPYSFSNFLQYESDFGTLEAVKSLQLENRTAMAIVDLINKNEWNDIVDLVPGGHISLISSAEQLVSLKAEYLAAKKAGLDVGDVEWISEESVKETYGASYPAVKAPAFNLWPLKFVTQLYLLANSSAPNFSLALHTHTPVTSVVPLPSSYDRKWNLHTPRGPIHCSYVLHASNAYASHLLPQFTPGRDREMGIIPTRGQIVAVRADTPINDSWRASWGFPDYYWFPRPTSSNASANPLVILGGGRETIGGPTFEQFETNDSVVNKDVGEALRAFLPRTFEGMFKDGEDPVMEWTGIMGYTSTKDPFVGPVIEETPSSSNVAATEQHASASQFISAGYNGHGMPRAFSCAEAVAGMIIATLRNDKTWSVPEWLPKRYLTWNNQN